MGVFNNGLGRRCTKKSLDSTNAAYYLVLPSVEVRAGLNHTPDEPAQFEPGNSHHERTTMKMFVRTILVGIILCSTAFARGGVDLGVIDIGELSKKDKDVFQEVSTKHLSKDKAFAIGFISVDFATRATYKARYGSGIGGGPTAEVTVILDGVSDEDMQAIADAASAIYEKELLAAGYEVVPRSELEATEGYMKIAEGSDPRGAEKKISALMRSSGTSHIKTFSAANGALWSSKAGMNIYKMTSKLKKGVIVHGFAIGFSTYKKDKEKKTRFNTVTKTISVEAVPLLTLGTQASWVAKNSKFGMLTGQQVWTVEKDFLTGLTAVEGEKDTFLVTVDPEAFKAGSIELIEASIKRTVAYFKSNRK